MSTHYAACIPALMSPTCHNVEQVQGGGQRRQVVLREARQRRRQQPPPPRAARPQAVQLCPQLPQQRREVVAVGGS